MSNSDNRLYLYDNRIDLVLTTTSMYVDNRPMNNRKLKAHKGVTNEIFFTIRDRDRKKQNVFSETLRAYLIDPGTKKRLLGRMLEHTSDVGVVKLIWPEADLANIEPGLYNLYLTRSDSEVYDSPLYSDQDNNLKFDIEITDQTSVQATPTQQIESFLQSGNTVLGDSANSFVSSAMFGNLERNYTNAQHTLAFSAPGYTGQVIIQASCLTTTPDSDDQSNDWFNVTTLDVADPQTTSNVVVNTFSVNCNWVRLLHYPTSGEIAWAQLRN